MERAKRPEAFVRFDFDYKPSESEWDEFSRFWWDCLFLKLSFAVPLYTRGKGEKNYTEDRYDVLVYDRAQSSPRLDETGFVLTEDIPFRRYRHPKSRFDRSGKKIISPREFAVKELRAYAKILSNMRYIVYATASRCRFIRQAFVRVKVGNWEAPVEKVFGREGGK